MYGGGVSKQMECVCVCTDCTDVQGVHESPAVEEVAEFLGVELLLQHLDVCLLVLILLLQLLVLLLQLLNRHTCSQVPQTPTDT